MTTRSERCYNSVLASLALSGLSNVNSFAPRFVDSEESQEDVHGCDPVLQSKCIGDILVKTSKGYQQELKTHISKEPPLNRSERRRRAKDQQCYERLIQKNKQNEDKT